MTPNPLRVVKVGGSLLTFSRLAPALRAWLHAQPLASNVLLAGGGALADVVRDWDARFQLGPERAHWLCVEVLRVSARLLANLLPEACLITDFDALSQQLHEPQDHRLVIFCPHRFLRDIEPALASGCLPQSWEATSDSIAARLAEVLGAGELVLLKSTDPPAPDASAGDFVDAYFARAAKRIPAVRFVNLRSG